MRFLRVLAAVVFSISTALASEPAQPLTLDDWEVLDPSFSLHPWASAAVCASAAALQVPENRPPFCSIGGLYEAPWWSTRVNSIGNSVDAEGNNWTARSQLARDAVGNPLMCLDTQRWRHEVLRCSTPDACTVIARVTDRCSEPPPGLSSWTDRARILALWIDNSNGYLYIRYKSFRSVGADGARSAIDEDRYGPNAWEVNRVEGLPTLFEILQTYTPSSALSFRVPYMPEGFQAADYFDTYWGNLTHPIDFSQAQGLQCSYPASPPSVGDHLEVADTLPTPALGTGYYYITAVNYQGQTRYGRKAVNGVLSGRDPAVLSACTSEVEQ